LLSQLRLELVAARHFVAMLLLLLALLLLALLLLALLLVVLRLMDCL
jgi:hypothetical protein